MNLNEMRAFLREHIDLDETDVSDTLVDSWLREGYRRVQEFTHNWPHLAAEQQFTVTGGHTSVTAFRAIHDVRDDRRTLVEIPHSSARRRWTNNSANSGLPAYYSLFNGELYLWPTPTTSTIWVRGTLEAPLWPVSTTGSTTVTTIQWPQTVFTVGYGAPNNANGSDGNHYVDATGFNPSTGHGGTLYRKVSGAWVGPQTLVFGTGSPTSATVANNGEYWVDTTNPAVPAIFGPRATVTTTVPTGVPAAQTPPNLPTRLTELVARWALSCAYLREGDFNMSQALRGDVGQELAMYQHRIRNLSNNERFALADGGVDPTPGDRLRYDWE